MRIRKTGGDFDAEWDAYEAFRQQHGDDAAMTSARFGWHCHSHIRGGMWEFLGDCTHALAGQRVPMVDYAKHIAERDAKYKAALRSQLEANVPNIEKSAPGADSRKWRPMR